MGLDMYLSARRYLSEYIDEDKKVQEAISNAMPNTNGMIPNRVVCEAMYWRKANAIHNWFVNNVQDGEDDCRDYYVDRSNLQELLDTINEVLEDNDKAKELLPTASGFFFGSEEYCDYYFGELTRTRNRIMELLSDKFDDWEFYYSSSW